MKKLFTLVQVLDNLCRMPRSGGVMFAGIDPNFTDSIADHNFKVVSLALLLGELFIKQGTPINFELLLKSAITHDWNESILLDIPSSSPSYRSYFDLDIRKTVASAEKKANETIESYISTIAPLKIDMDNLSVEEKDILVIADISALLLEALEWKYKGLRYEWIEHLWNNTVKRLDLVTSKYPYLSDYIPELQSAFENGVKPANPFLTKQEFQSEKK